MNAYTQIFPWPVLPTWETWPKIKKFEEKYVNVWKKNSRILKNVWLNYWSVYYVLLKITNRERLKNQQISKYLAKTST